MIELAPRHKTGLVIKSPCLPMAGFFGYGQSPYPTLLEPGQFGALVTGPITLRPQPHQVPPQALEIGGGVIFNTPPRNLGVRKIISRYKRFWRRADIPIIAHLPADDPDDLTRTAGALAGLDLIAGLELGLPLGIKTHQLEGQIKAIQRRSELPLLVKLPLTECHHLAPAALEAGADGLVIAANPAAAGYTADGDYLNGLYFGPGLIAGLIPHLVQLQQRHPEAVLIAGGGIHTVSDARACLQAGATAIQLDTLIFTNPGQTATLLSTFYD